MADQRRTEADTNGHEGDWRPASVIQQGVHHLDHGIPGQRPQHQMY